MTSQSIIILLLQLTLLAVLTYYLSILDDKSLSVGRKKEKKTQPSSDLEGNHRKHRLPIAIN